MNRSGPHPALDPLRLACTQVMGWWPFKQLLLRNGAKSAGKYALPCRVLTHFGATDRVRAALHLTNLLTGWGAAACCCQLASPTQLSLVAPGAVPRPARATWPARPSFPSEPAWISFR